ncbi:MAG: hypothetical protein KGJ93_02510 [Patescibacteria group bacterium]|nr:hypothetical protein [Patescibacteria group bacterium]
MNSQEKILDQALLELHQGSSTDKVFSKYPQNKAELAPLLSLAQNLSELPKKNTPLGAMRRKYALTPVKTVWYQSARVFRLASVSASAMLLLAVLVGTGYAASISKPGQTLFGLKKSAEHLQMVFALNPQQKLALQLEIAQKRLDDARAILNNPQADPAQRAAALAELTSETQNSVDAADQAAKNQTTALALSKDQPLLNSLETITSQQQALAKRLQPQIAQSAIDAAKKNAAKVAEIKKYLAVADNEQTLAQLSSNPNAFTASGTIISLGKTSISVAGKNFDINDQTIIKDLDSDTLTWSDLKLDQQVQILGDKTDKGLLARQITIQEYSDNGQVKGATTQSTSTASSTVGNLKPSADNGEQATQPDPNTAVGTFIMEDPAPQTNFSK